MANREMELFGYELFNRLWLHYGLISEPFPLYYKHSTKDDSHLTDSIVDAVKVMQVFFHNFYKRMFDAEYNFKNSPSDIYRSLMLLYPHEDFYNCYMDLFLSSCAFVAEVCQYCYRHHHKDILSKSYLIWAEFAEARFGIEFYKRGAWRELKRNSKLYASLLMFLKETSTTLNTAFGKNFICHPIRNTFRAYNCLMEFVDMTTPYSTSSLWINCFFQGKLDLPSLHREAGQDQNPSLGNLENIVSHLKMMCNPERSRTVTVNEYEQSIASMFLEELITPLPNSDSFSADGEVTSTQSVTLASHQIKKEDLEIPGICQYVHPEVSNDTPAALKSLNEHMMYDMNVSLSNPDRASEPEQTLENEMLMLFAVSQHQSNKHCVSDDRNSSNNCPEIVLCTDSGNVISNSDLSLEGLKAAPNCSQKSISKRKKRSKRKESSTSYIQNVQNSRSKPPLPSNPNAHGVKNDEKQAALLQLNPSSFDDVILPKHEQNSNVLKRSKCKGNKPSDITHVRSRLRPNSTPGRSPISSNTNEEKAVENKTKCSNLYLNSSPQHGKDISQNPTRISSNDRRKRYSSNTQSSRSELLPVELSQSIQNAATSEEQLQVRYLNMDDFCKSITSIKTIQNRFSRPPDGSKMEKDKDQKLALYSPKTENSGLCGDTSSTTIAGVENKNEVRLEHRRSTTPLTSEIPSAPEIQRTQNTTSETNQMLQGTPLPENINDSFEDFDVNIVLGMILVLGCQPGLRFMKSSFEHNQAIRSSKDL